MSELPHACATGGLCSPFVVQQNDTRHSVISPRRPWTASTLQMCMATKQMRMRASGECIGSALSRPRVFSSRVGTRLSIFS